MRKLFVNRLIFVASPGFVATHSITSDPAGVVKLPFLSFQEQTERPTWTVHGPEGALQTVTFDPVLWTSEFDVLVTAACAGTGFALLPEESVRTALREGRLARILPDWHSDGVTIHLVFPTGRGLRPAVRVLIDYIAAQVGGE